MILRFNKKLTTLDIFANGSELATVMGRDTDSDGKRVYSWPDSEAIKVAEFKNPVLVTDNHKIAKFSPALRDTVFALYGNPRKTVEYDGTILHFDSRKYPGVWSPSIDTLFFCRAIGSQDFSSARTAAELGSGSGFISKYTLEKNPNLEEMTLVDLNPNAEKCARDNISDRRARYVTGDGLAFLQGKKFDLVFCNPPYIVRPSSIDDNPYEGISLLIGLIKNAGDLLSDNGRMIINISTLSGAEPYAAMRNGRVDSEPLDRLTVPLKVMNVLNNPAWMSYLKNRGVLHAGRREGYDYWQTLTMWNIEKHKPVETK